MDSLSSKLHHSHLPFSLPHSSTPTHFSSLSFQSTPLPPFPSSFQLFSIKASSTPTPSPSPSPSPSTRHLTFQKPQNPLTHVLQTLNPLLSPLVKPTCIAIAATAFFFTRLHLNPAAAASPPAPPPAPPASETLPSEQKVSPSEEQPSADADELRSLLEAKIKAREMDAAIRVLERLIELEPEELQLQLLKAHLCIHNGENELASKVFEELLEKEPFNVEAYRGLLMATSELNKPTEELLKRIEEAVKVCEEEERDSEVRDFKLLIAQIKVIDGDLSDALRVYQELVKEEPKDFRPYLCQGIVYTMLKKKDEAEKQFEKYRRHVPKDHPYKEYFEDNTRIFSQKLGRGGIGAKS